MNVLIVLLKDIKIDPDHKMAFVDPPPSIDNFDVLVNLNLRIQNSTWSIESQKALSLFNESEKVGMNSLKNWFRLGMILYACEQYQESIKAFDYMLASNNGERDIPFINSYWKGLLNDLLGNREKAIGCYKKALEVYPGYPWSHSQFNLKIDDRWLKERLISPYKGHIN